MTTDKENMRLCWANDYRELKWPAIQENIKKPCFPTSRQKRKNKKLFKITWLTQVLPGAT